MSQPVAAQRAPFDREMVDIVDYVMNYRIESDVAWRTAHYCLLDTLGCGLEALEYLSLIHISEPTRHTNASRMPSSA